MARRRNIWERLNESTEGPSVTVSLPREFAEELMRSLMSSLEIEDDMDGEDMDIDALNPHPEPDEDDMGGPSDFDADDMPDGGLDFSSDDEDDMPAGDDDADEDDTDDDDEDDTDENTRPGTALGESHRKVAKKSTKSLASYITRRRK